jgi:hypothetical protein
MPCRDGVGRNNEWPLLSESDIQQSAISLKVKPYVRPVCTQNLPFIWLKCMS